MLGAARSGVRRVVYAASSSIYGSGPELPRRETQRPDPQSPYAASKLAAEYYLHSLGALHGVETVALRYFNIFGPGQDPASEYAAVVPRFIVAGLNGESPTIYGDGHQTRDFTYVDNVVAANLAAAVRPGISRLTCNVGCGGRFSLLDLLARVEEALGVDVTPTFGPARAGDVPHSQADISLAVERLGFDPAVGFDDGVRRTVNWFRERHDAARAGASEGAVKSAGVTEPGLEPNAATSGVVDPARPERVLGHVGGSTAILTVAALGGQVAALLREIFVASQIGPTASLDALLVALVMPVLVSGLLTSGIRAALVPAHAEIAATEDRPRLAASWGDHYLDDDRRGLDRDRDADAARTRNRTCRTRPSARSEGLGHLLSSASSPTRRPRHTQSVARGNLPDRRTLRTDRAGLADRPRRIARVRGVSVGSTGSIGGRDRDESRVGRGCRADGDRSGSDPGVPPLTLLAPREEIVGFLRHAGPLTAGSGLLQFNLLVDRAIASLLSVGAVSVLKFGQQLVTEPLASLSTAWTTSLYPSLVRSSVGGQERSLGALSALALRYTLAIFVPVSFGVAALAPLLVDVVYRRGAFDAVAASDTALVVAAFSPMLALTMILPILTGAHNARRNGTLLAVTAVSNAVLNLLLNVAFGRLFGVTGVALSTSITMAILLVFLAWRLARSEADFDRRAVIRVGWRVLLASAVPAVIVGTVAWNLLGSPLRPGKPGGLGVLATGGAVGYMGMALLLGIREPRTSWPAWSARSGRSERGGVDDPETGRPDGRIRVAYLNGSLGIGGSERQMVELARRLPRDTFAPEFVLLTDRGPLADLAESSGVPVRVLHWAQPGEPGACCESAMSRDM